MSEIDGWCRTVASLFLSGSRLSSCAFTSACMQLCAMRLFHTTWTSFGTPSRGSAASEIVEADVSFAKLRTTTWNTESDLQPILLQCHRDDMLSFTEWRFSSVSVLWIWSHLNSVAWEQSNTWLRRLVNIDIACGRTVGVRGLEGILSVDTGDGARLGGKLSSRTPPAASTRACLTWSFMPSRSMPLQPASTTLASACNRLHTTHQNYSNTPLDGEHKCWAGNVLNMKSNTCKCFWFHFEGYSDWSTAFW